MSPRPFSLGCLICESCSSYRTRLPQFGYAEYGLYKMDYTGLSKLNIKTLRGYLLSYNISTQGMIEKQGQYHDMD
ncbi:hypothetical protein BG000_000617 [Podila horticola]|nr:hypothetical protein BG000_000617 [Podila horticola]